MRILFAEDDVQLRTAVTRGLEEAGYVVVPADTGGEAHGLASTQAWDAVILDVLLPHPDGIAVCRAIRAAGNRTPILMLTALDAVEHRIAGLDAGADDYLTKPFDFGELLARLRALIRRHHEHPAPLLAVADLTIDTARHRVRRGSRDIVLTGKEYAFLVHLAQNAGRVVSRAELMATVWEDARNTYSNILDVYASRLRRKVDESGEAPLVSTVRGAGFMLAAPDELASPAPAAKRGPRKRG